MPRAAPLRRTRRLHLRSVPGGPDAVTGQPGDGHRLVVGSAGFTESDLLAQMYALLLQEAGHRTRILSVTNRELYEPALENGQIDVVPEYAATFADWLNAKVHGADAPTVGSPDLTATMTALRTLAEPRGLAVLDPGRAVDQNAFAVTAAYAAEHRLKTLSDLGAARLPVRLAAGDECVRRPYCAPGLKEVYGIDVTAVDPKGVGTTQAKQAVQSGQDQLMLTTTTDATLDTFGLVLLADDKHLQNADVIVPVVNRAGRRRGRHARARPPQHGPDHHRPGAPQRAGGTAGGAFPRTSHGTTSRRRDSSRTDVPASRRRPATGAPPACDPLSSRGRTEQEQEQR
ncbi:hypothetical protein STANM309S_03935 [Streptomyces tanashiensis]